MPLDKNKKMRYYKITVFFKTGKKVYTVPPNKYKSFMSEMKKRKDVIDYLTESIHSFIYSKNHYKKGKKQNEIK